jgi:hypothetical protein
MSDQPISLLVSDDLRRRRLTVFFRLLLAIPHYKPESENRVSAVIAVLFFRASSPMSLREGAAV